MHEDYVVEVHDYDPMGPSFEGVHRHFRDLEIYGRTHRGQPTGRWLTADDAQAQITSDGLHVTTGEDGSPQVDEDQVLQRLQAAFSGARLGYCPDGLGTELHGLDIDDPAPITVIELVRECRDDCIAEEH